MLAEILVFTLLAGSAVLAHVYRVFGPGSRSSAVRDLRLKLVETVLFGTAPAVVGIVLGLPVVAKDPTLYTVYFIASLLFVLFVVLRYAFPDDYFLSAVRSGVDTAVEVGTPLLLVGMAVILAVTSHPAEAVAPFCLVYLSLFYFWVNDADGDTGESWLNFGKIAYAMPSQLGETSV